MIFRYVHWYIISFIFTICVYIYILYIFSNHTTTFSILGANIEQGWSAAGCCLRFLCIEGAPWWDPSVRGYTFFCPLKDDGHYLLFKKSHRIWWCFLVRIIFEFEFHCFHGFLFDTQQIQAKFSWNLKEAMKEALRLDGQDCCSFVIWSRGWRLNNLSNEKNTRSSVTSRSKSSKATRVPVPLLLIAPSLAMVTVYVVHWEK